MSLILEALKKSERQRRLGEAPSLGTPVGGVRRRRSRLPLLIGLIAVALAVGWWLRREPPAPASVATAPAEPAPSPASPSFDTPAATGGVDARVSTDATDNRARAQSNAASRLPRSRVPADAQAGIDPALREKLASGELVVANPALLKPGQAATVKESAPMPPGAAPQEQAVPMAPPVAPAVAAESASPAIAPPAATGTRPATEVAAPGKNAADARPVDTAKTAPPTAAAPASADAGPQLLWALPYAQRRGIPELKLSMHVYAADPAQRFVIINGNRQVEGDEFEGLKLIEIRNDGLVLALGQLRFVYPRGGR